MFLAFYKIIFFPKIIINPSKSPTSNLASNIPIKQLHRSICKSVQSFQPVVVNVNVVSVPVRQKHISSTHNVRKVFTSIHNSISIPRQVYCPENNNNNIANTCLPLTNLISSFEAKPSTPSLTSNLSFSECTFSLPEISCSRIYHHVSSSVKFSLFFMILFNAMLLHQPLQNVTDFTLFLLVCLKFYYKTCGAMTFYIKQYENLLCFLFDSFLTCNVLKITCSIPIEDFSLNFKVFILITTCLVFCLKKKTHL